MTNGLRKHCLVLKVQAEKFISLEEKCGGNIDKATPDPISNSVVKLIRADDTWLEAAWESRTSPLFSIRPHGQAVKTSPFHGGNPSSILGGVTKT